MAYFDHAATTPMLDEALEAYVAAAREVGNASSLHAPGRLARRRVEESRECIAAALGARPSEVIFTSGGTEADNLAVKGIFWAQRDAADRRNRIVASRIEHHAVLDSVEWLARHEGAQITWVPADGVGRVQPEALRDALGDAGDVALVTTMWANNEIGTVQPVPSPGHRGRGGGRADAHRRHPGSRSGAGGLRGVRGGRDVGDRAQTRRPGRRRGAPPWPRYRLHTAAARRRAGARRPFGHAGRRRHRRVRRRGRVERETTAGICGNGVIAPG